MSSALIDFPPPVGHSPLVDKSGQVNIESLRNFLSTYNGASLETVDTTAGNANFGVPFSNAINQNKEIVFVKISSDGHTPTLVPSGTDLINGAASVNMNTAQYSVTRLKADGGGNWYVVGKI